MTNQKSRRVFEGPLSEMRRDIDLQSAKLDDKLNAMEKVQNDFIVTLESNIGVRDDQVNAKVRESIDTSNKAYAQLYEMTQALVNGRDKAEVGEILFEINVPVKIKPMTPIMKTSDSARKIDFESSPNFETSV